MIAALCTFLAMLATPILGQDSQDLSPPSPCPTVFTYDLPGPEPGWWSGVVRLSTDSLLHSLWLDIVLDSQAMKLLYRMAEITTQDFQNFRIENEDMQIQPGIPKLLRFSVQYDTNDEIPGVQTIRLNGIVICNALSAEEQTDSRLKTNINSNMRPVINSSKLYDPGNISNAGDNFSGRRGQTPCGTSSIVSQWPWAASLYRTSKRGNGQVSGGTLISLRHVITSAKVVHVWFTHNSGRQTLIDANSLVVYLGKHKFSAVVGVQIKLVQKIIVSPDYNVLTTVEYSGHDVALLVLHEPVTYTDWVRPVCLWPANEIDLDSVIGKKGWLVGWGYDEKSRPTEKLSDVEIPVVSHETCNKSKDYLHYGLTKTMNYYCAGDREDTELCKGVAEGNGMVFKMGNSWYLRGLVSFFLGRILNSVFVCDPTKYFGFTDVAQYVPWIHSIASNYI